MRVTRALLSEQEEQAIEVVWRFRSDPMDVRAAMHVGVVEARWPGLLTGLDRGDCSAYWMWMGRLATLRHLSAGAAGEWDGPGAFDT